MQKSTSCTLTLPWHTRQKNTPPSLSPLKNRGKKKRLGQVIFSCCHQRQRMDWGRKYSTIYIFFSSSHAQKRRKRFRRRALPLGWENLRPATVFLSFSLLPLSLFSLSLAHSVSHSLFFLYSLLLGRLRKKSESLIGHRPLSSLSPRTTAGHTRQ